LESGLTNNFLGWPQTTILPISASQATGIIGVSHQHLASLSFLICKMRIVRSTLWNYYGDLIRLLEQHLSLSEGFICISYCYSYLSCGGFLIFSAFPLLPSKVLFSQVQGNLVCLFLSRQVLYHWVTLQQ
jgi:hypothetical protein